MHVETPPESVQKISTADFRALLDNINLAADMGAEVVWLKSPEVVKALLDFAREQENNPDGDRTDPVRPYGTACCGDR